MKRREFKKLLKKTWHFIWEDDSIWSWIVNIILAFVLIKFIVYPALGFLLGTSHPVVAVVSESMEHNMEFGAWWEKNKEWHIENGIGKKDFEEFQLKNGFNKGDIMVLAGKDAESIEIGEVIVFKNGKKDPIIHRVVKKMQKEDGIYFQTKGDNNRDSINSSQLDETNVGGDAILGKVILRVPLLGYIKIWFVEILKFIGLEQ